MPGGGGDPFDLDGPSFSALLRRHAPHVHAAAFGQPAAGGQVVDHVEGTTIVALTYDDGVIITGDRRATAGNVIAKRDMRKVFEADSWSAVGISGAAGPAMELAKIFATELEHYEKVEGGPLSLEGKANKLAQMVRANLPMAMQGLVVVPLFAGYDPRTRNARIYEFDPSGGRYEERRFATSGSGGRDARGSLKARYREDLDVDAAVGVAIEALWDAADEDSATGGPDLVRGIYPLLAVIDAEGYRELDDATVARRVQAVIADRQVA
ncbi:MAG: proteasome subunit beta [Euzebyales bacterium]|nr:proteasome subunit beta [Euzebyales bacterium]MBA3620749.1 proteasome subunit beta [Euzebyales bacterium]